MPISVHVHLLSGKSVTLETAEDDSVDTLNLRDTWEYFLLVGYFNS